MMHLTFCQRHWAAFREKLRELDLLRFVSTSHEDLLRRIDSDDGYDPLFGGMLRLTTEAMTQGVREFFQDCACPICAADRHTPDELVARGELLGDQWMATEAMHQLRHAKHLGLVKVQ